MKYKLWFSSKPLFRNLCFKTTNLIHAWLSVDMVKSYRIPKLWDPTQRLLKWQSTRANKTCRKISPREIIKHDYPPPQEKKRWIISITTLYHLHLIPRSLFVNKETKQKNKKQKFWLIEKLHRAKYYKQNKSSISFIC